MTDTFKELESKEKIGQLQLIYSKKLIRKNRALIKPIIRLELITLFSKLEHSATFFSAGGVIFITF